MASMFILRSCESLFSARCEQTCLQDGPPSTRRRPGRYLTQEMFILLRNQPCAPPPTSHLPALPPTPLLSWCTAEEGPEKKKEQRAAHPPLGT